MSIPAGKTFCFHHLPARSGLSRRVSLSSLSLSFSGRATKGRHKQKPPSHRTYPLVTLSLTLPFYFPVPCFHPVQTCSRTLRYTATAVPLLQAQVIRTTISTSTHMSLRRSVDVDGGGYKGRRTPGKRICKYIIIT